MATEPKYNLHLPSPEIPPFANPPLTFKRPVIPFNLPKNPDRWRDKDVLVYLRANKVQFELDESEIGVLYGNRITGSILTTLTTDDLEGPPFNLLYGPAHAISTLINTLKLSATAWLRTYIFTLKSRQTSLLWPIRKPEDATIANMVQRMRKVYPEIILSDVTTLLLSYGQEEYVIRDDEKLRLFLQAASELGKKCITITLERSDLPFTYYTFPKVCNMFGLPDHLQFLPEFAYKKSPMTDPGTSYALKNLLAELQARLDTIDSGGTDGLEALYSQIIYSFLVQATSVHKGSMFIRPQKEIVGDYGRGPIDFALQAKSGKGALGVTEVKKGDFQNRIAQNIVQLESGLTDRKWGFFGDFVVSEADNQTAGASQSRKVYGIVTDAQRWYILKRTPKAKGFSFNVSKISSVIAYGGTRWEKQAEEVFCVLVWLLGQMLKS